MRKSNYIQRIDYGAIRLVYKKNVKIIVTTPTPPNKIIGPLPNYPTPAPVLNGTARSTKKQPFHYIY